MSESAEGRVPRPEAGRRPRGIAWRWAWPQLPLAIVVGLAWWALAPGGRSVPDPGYLSAAEAPGSQDSWLAVLGVGAGAVVALSWVARRPVSPDRGSVSAITGAVVGALVAGAVAAGVGLLVDLLTRGLHTSTEPGALTQLQLRAPAALLLWPLTLVLVVLVDTARDMVATWLRQLPRRTRLVS